MRLQRIVILSLAALACSLCTTASASAIKLVPEFFSRNAKGEVLPLPRLTLMAQAPGTSAVMYVGDPKLKFESYCAGKLGVALGPETALFGGAGEYESGISFQWVACSVFSVRSPTKPPVLLPQCAIRVPFEQSLADQLVYGAGGEDFDVIYQKTPALNPRPFVESIFEEFTIQRTNPGIPCNNEPLKKGKAPGQNITGTYHVLGAGLAKLTPGTPGAFAPTLTLTFGTASGQLYWNETTKRAEPVGLYVPPCANALRRCASIFAGGMVLELRTGEEIGAE